MENSSDLTYARKKLEVARLEESEVLPIIQSLTATTDQNDDFRLLQLKPELVDYITEGKVLTIRGEPNEMAVVCTDTCTYELKEAETSNSMLLLPNILWPSDCNDKESEVISQSVSGIFHNYFELRNIKPSFKKLHALLEQNSYKGKEYESESTCEKFTLKTLLEFVQSSEEELKVALSEMHTCIIDGYIRLLDFDYKFNVVSQIINVVESKSLPLNKIPKRDVIEELKDLEPIEILENCFSWFTEDALCFDEEGNKLYAFKEDPICQLFGEILLRAAGKFHLNEFLESWQRSVPEGMTCNLNQLQGLALTDTNSRPEAIFYFPYYNLSENVGERFDKLFQVKEKWSYEEIVPYLQDRVAAGSDVKSLLIKYTRESTKDGKKMYSSKW